MTTHEYKRSVRAVSLILMTAAAMLTARALYGQQDQRLRAALPAVVALVSLDSNNQPLATGSGTVISGSGAILTNYHVVGDIARRQLFHPKGLVAVFMLSRSDEPARLAALAKVVQGSPHTDLAILEIISDARGEPIDPNRLNLPSAPLGDSDVVDIGEQVTLLGFPGIGNRTASGEWNDHFYVTLTPATVSGFQREGGFRAWIRTTDPISAGNSGGAAIDAAGCLVGVPSAGRSRQENLEKMGLIRPINYVPASWISSSASRMRPCPRSAVKSSAPDAPVESGPRPTAQCTNCGVVFTGRIVDANTGRGIPGAIFAIVKSTWTPGTELKDSDIMAGGTADAQGNFQTEPAIRRGVTYLFIIAASGYKPMRESIEIGNNVPEVVSFPQPLKLHR